VAETKMKSFPGFRDSDASTPIPDTFFNVLLKDIQDENELRVVLYALWRVARMEGTYQALSETEFAGEAAGIEPVRVAAGLERAVQRGALLRATHEAQTLYFLNSARGRADAQAFAERGTDEMTSTASLPLERPNVFRLYEQNIGPLTPLIADALKEAEASYAPQWIADAIELAVEHNKRSWKYCEAILKRWKEEGRGQKQNRRDDQAARRRDAKDKIKRFLEG
jgi:DNA replication protein